MERSGKSAARMPAASAAARPAPDTPKKWRRDSMLPPLRPQPGLEQIQNFPQYPLAGLVEAGRGLFARAPGTEDAPQVQNVLQSFGPVGADLADEDRSAAEHVGSLAALAFVPQVPRRGIEVRKRRGRHA